MNLFKSIKNGRDYEFDILLRENLNGMFSLALRMTRNQLDAEDLIQDTALKAFRYFHKFDRGTNFRAWITAFSPTILLTFTARIRNSQHKLKLKMSHSN